MRLDPELDHYIATYQAWKEAAAHHATAVQERAKGRDVGPVELQHRLEAAHAAYNAFRAAADRVAHRRDVAPLATQPAGGDEHA